MRTFGPHTGSDWRYKKGCRCSSCKKAHSIYENKQKVLREKEKAGVLVRQRQIVDATEVREHILFLMRHNVGARSIGDATGISYTTIYEIANQQRSTCTKKIANKILALSAKKIYKHQMIDTKIVKSLINEMKATGLKKYEIGLMLGYKDGRFNIYKNMQAHNYKKIVELHSKICPKKEEP